MKNVTLASFTSLCFLLACQKADAPKEETLPEPETTVMSPASRQCASMEVLEAQIAADPARGKRLEAIEAFTARTLASGSKLLADGITIEIPVVVHVLYKTQAENISLAQINSQIAVLNEDFQMQNADSKLVTDFSGVKSAIPVTFVLSQVVRKATNKKSWGTNDAMKKTSLGGSDPIDPATKLNMWSCNLGQSLLGYAQFPGGSLATDGVVVLFSAFGSRLKYGEGTYAPNYDLGRTATHEVGHWLNLRHIWGDATCGNDFVGDTPQHNASNGGCPQAGSRSTCAGTPLEMWMNYMDYTYDKCMYMFTSGQKDRAMAVFNTGGPRASFR